MLSNKGLAAVALGATLFGLQGCTKPAGSNATTPTAAPPPASPAIATPPVTLAPDLEFDKAKAQKGYEEVRKLTNPLSGDLQAAKAGAALFATNCAACHGVDGRGDGPAGISLNPKPRNLGQLSEYHLGKGDLGIFRTVKYGIDGTGMAPWEGRMTDEECWKVTNYVRTLQKQ